VDNKCICDAEEDYGTITSKQWEECQADKAEIEAAANGGKGKGKGKKSKRPKGCFDCTTCPGLVADENGKCVDLITYSSGRRLFGTDEDIWV
jgi:hypothetical protein